FVLIFEVVSGELLYKASFETIYPRGHDQAANHSLASRQTGSGQLVLILYTRAATTKRPITAWRRVNLAL
ncbi:MAG: hypothetical protein KBS83_07705, partial [Lachnospiraceae bacterium]|nr:hypothetical protein [Candidatus Equihabitans merdae]